MFIEATLYLVNLYCKDHYGIISSLCIPLNVHFLTVWSSLGVVESCLNYAGYESAKIMRSDGTFHGQNELMCYRKNRVSSVKGRRPLKFFPSLPRPGMAQCCV